MFVDCWLTTVSSILYIQVLLFLLYFINSFILKVSTNHTNVNANEESSSSMNNLFYRNDHFTSDALLFVWNVYRCDDDDDFIFSSNVCLGFLLKDLKFIGEAWTWTRFVFLLTTHILLVAYVYLLCFFFHCGHFIITIIRLYAECVCVFFFVFRAIN